MYHKHEGIDLKENAFLVPNQVTVIWNDCISVAVTVFIFVLKHVRLYCGIVM